LKSATPDQLFCPDYHADRAAFVAEVQSFAARTSRSLQLHTHVVHPEQDLVVTAAELPARRPERVYVLCTGIHGIEGYAGSAIVRQLLRGLLDRLDPDNTALLIVHALNPYGFAHFQRVNANNVDLNRNCEAHAEDLFSTDSSAFAALTNVLAPARRLRASLASRLRFKLALLAVLRRHGAQTLRQASLSGQYVAPGGIFFGGQRVEPEVAFFQALYERIAQLHGEVLLTDLHTGYGARGQAYPLFGQADSAELRAFTELGVTDTRGENKTYTVHGDLVGYCYKTAKRLRPAGAFNGLVIEIGTGSLSVLDQIHDLYTVVSENQLRQHGSIDTATQQRIRAEFREMFYPGSPEWRSQAVRVGALAVERLLDVRHYLRPIRPSA
jgi:hypothetical protein